MRRRARLVFLLLILVQAAHSVEEYATRLYEVFAPATFLSGLVSSNLSLGFAIANSAIVLFGLWCYFVPVRSGRPSARGWAWLWVVVELAHGSGHTAMALAAGGYFPGAATGPLLFIVAAWLAVLLLRSQPLRELA